MNTHWTTYLISLLFMIIGVLNFMHSEPGMGTLYFTLGVVFAIPQKRTH